MLGVDLDDVAACSWRGVGPPDPDGRPKSRVSLARICLPTLGTRPAEWGSGMGAVMMDAIPAPGI
jgi:hypothetical protein